MVGTSSPCRSCFSFQQASFRLETSGEYTRSHERVLTQVCAAGGGVDCPTAYVEQRRQRADRLRSGEEKSDRRRPAGTPPVVEGGTMSMIMWPLRRPHR